MKIFFVISLIVLPFLCYCRDGSSLIKTQPTTKETDFKRLYQKAKDYFAKNEYDSSVYYLYKIISKSDKKTEFYLKSHIFLGYIFSNTEKFDLSEKYLKIALTISSDSLTKSQIQGNLGELYFKMEKPKNALTCFQKAESFLTDKKRIDYQIVLSNIGAAYIQLNQANKALAYNTKAFELAIELGDKLGESICINNFATIYRDLNQSKKALEFYQKALSIVDELGSKEEKKTILFNLSQLHEKLGNSLKSLTYFKQYTNLKDELFNTEKNEFIVETQEKYDATERKKEIAELKLSEQKKDARHMRIIYMIVISSIVIVFMGLILFFRIRWKNIQAKNQTKLELISATFDAEEKERQRISQDIHDELGGLLGVSRMLFTQTKKHLSDVNLELYNRVDELLVQANVRSRTISHELFSPTLKQFGLYPAINEYLQNIQEIHLDLNIEFEMTEIKLESQLELNIFRITQELITNTIKYAQAQKIAIKIEITPKDLNYTYFDDGVGFDYKTIKKGVGLNSITDRISRFHGEIDVKSYENKGFKANFIIPL